MRDFAGLFRVVREDPSNGLTFVRDLSGENYQRSLGRGNSKCKVPEAATHLLCLRTSKEAVWLECSEPRGE